MKFPNKGLLSDADFIEILKDASQSGLTGMIRIENGPVIKVIYFQKGTISFASSNEKTDRLTEVLVVGSARTGGWNTSPASLLEPGKVSDHGRNPATGDHSFKLNRTCRDL
jgi:hypothetical protein